MEKIDAADVEAAAPGASPERVSDESKPSVNGLFARLNARIHSIKYLEARGIERVPESERHKVVGASNYMQMTLLWFSTNITANNIAVGMLGPLDFGLGFTDAALCAAFGAVLGAIGVAYMSTFGPVSGNRTMV
jgi:purine-cytosine permease-like protein